ncbi:MAG TPA: GAF domain-containing protein [Polyangiaceae bacterium]
MKRAGGKPARADVEAGAATMWIETLVLTLALPAVGWFFRRSDPFFLRAGFPWIALGPILAALRYGFAPGLLGGVSLAFLLALGRRLHRLDLPEFPAEVVLGTVGVAMVCGQFSNVWRRRVSSLDTEHAFLRQHFEAFSRAHRLLEFSHERLESRLGSGAHTLREALQALKRDFEGPHVKAELASVASRLVDLFGVFGMIEVASLHAATEAGMVAQPLAVLGSPPAVAADDGLVLTAIETRKLAFVRGGVESEASQRPSNLLAAVPLVDVDGATHGVLAVHAMPFLAFHDKNLHLLAALAGHMADVLTLGTDAGDVTPTRRDEFERRLRRAGEDAGEGVGCTVVRIDVQRGSPATALIDDLFTKELRELDYPLVVRPPDADPAIFVLLPLTDADHAGQLRARLDRTCHHRIGGSLTEAKVTLTVRDALQARVRDEVMREIDSLLGDAPGA